MKNKKLINRLYTAQTKYDSLIGEAGGWLQQFTDLEITLLYQYSDGWVVVHDGSGRSGAPLNMPLDRFLELCNFSDKLTIEDFEAISI